MYLHSVIPLYTVVLSVSGGVHHSHQGFILPNLDGTLQFTEITLYNFYVTIKIDCIKLLLMLTQHFRLLLLHVKSFELAKHRLVFIVKQSEEMQCSSKMSVQIMIWLFPAFSDFIR